MELKDESIILRIKEVMREHGITRQTALGDAIGMNQSTISAMFKLSRSSGPLVDAISKTFKVSKSWLLTGSGMKYEAEAMPETLANAVEITNTDRVELLKRLNDLYARHQKIMDEAQDIMKAIVDINKKLILGETDIAGI